MTTQIHEKFKTFINDNLQTALATASAFTNSDGVTAKSLGVLNSDDGEYIVSIGYTDEPNQNRISIDIEEFPEMDEGDLADQIDGALSAMTAGKNVICHSLLDDGDGLLLGIFLLANPR